MQIATAFVPLFVVASIATGALSRRYPRYRRVFGAAGGFLCVVFGLLQPPYLPFVLGNAALILRWTVVASGVALILAAWFDWMPAENDDALQRPAANRPLRHFGETS